MVVRRRQKFYEFEARQSRNLGSAAFTPPQCPRATRITVNNEAVRSPYFEAA
jgi:hypothetical protein